MWTLADVNKEANQLVMDLVDLGALEASGQLRTPSPGPCSASCLARQGCKVTARQEPGPQSWTPGPFDPGDHHLGWVSRVTGFTLRPASPAPYVFPAPSGAANTGTQRALPKTGRARGLPDVLRSPRPKESQFAKEEFAAGV